ncbi:sigma-70 family RNA polymerase sigma factor [soil metagenome]
MSVREGQQAELVNLLARAAAGDRLAFRQLYDATAPKLFASIRRILRNSSAAEDALQEAYVRVWARAADFDAGIATPMAWMATIARHAAIDVVRRGAEKVSQASASIDADLAERLADPSAGADAGMAGPLLARCLGGLDADRRARVLLAYAQGWSREELAARFQRPVATIKTLLRRSLIALKECLGDRD